MVADVSCDPALIDHLKQLITHASQHYNKRLPMPELSCTLSGQKAGELRIQRITWHRRIYQLRLNQILLQQHRDYFFQQVIPHEVAHLVVDRLYLRHVKPHGVEWRSVMMECFGCEPYAYHSLPTQNARQHKREYLYRCSCRSHYFTARRHQAAQQGSRYVCRACRQILAAVTSELADPCT